MRLGKIQSVVWCLTVWLGLTAVPAAGQAPQTSAALPAMPMVDPFQLNNFDPFARWWGPALYMDYGVFAPQSGTWDKLVMHGLTTSVGTVWKYADWTGDILPPSSTFFIADYRYAYLRGDKDNQLYGPGFVGDVDNLKLHLAEFGVRQRFPGLIGRRTYIEVGTTVGLGLAEGEIVTAAPRADADPVFVTSRNEDGFILRGELNTGVGMQVGRFDFKFGTAYGLSGSNALSGGFTSQGDFCARLSGTIYFD